LPVDLIDCSQVHDGNLSPPRAITLTLDLSPNIVSDNLLASNLENNVGVTCIK
jgi:hypothetical protein